MNANKNECPDELERARRRPFQLNSQDYTVMSLPDVLSVFRTDPDNSDMLFKKHKINRMPGIRVQMALRALPSSV